MKIDFNEIILSALTKYFVNYPQISRQWRMDEVLDEEFAIDLVITIKPRPKPSMITLNFSPTKITGN